MQEPSLLNNKNDRNQSQLDVQPRNSTLSTVIDDIDTKLEWQWTVPTTFPNSSDVVNYYINAFEESW